MLKNYVSARKKIAGRERGECLLRATNFFSAEIVTEGLSITTIFTNRRTTVSYAKVKKQTHLFQFYSLLWPVQGT